MTEILEHISLSQFTTIQTGGPARYFVSCIHEAEILDALMFAKSNRLKVLVLGGGSNLLIRDNGFDGLVIQNCLQGISFLENNMVEVGAGVNWDTFVSACCHKGLSGIEVLSGIPGSVGATPVQNVGAYGQEVKHVITRVHAICRNTFRERIFENNECHFSYRNSFFKDMQPDQWIITKVIFRLTDQHLTEIKYEELRRELEKNSNWQTLDLPRQIQWVRDTVLMIRSRKGMVLDPADLDSRSLGSFFINPVVDEATKNTIFDRALSLKTPTLPVAHATADQLWKLSAAWLIENSGIKKGLVLGSARVSTKHVLAITNPNHGSATDVLALADHMRKKVLEVFGVSLVQEPILI